MQTFVRAGLLAAALAAGTHAAAAQGVLRTNEADIEEALRTSDLDVGNPMAVFAFVLGQLPERVKVLPTENYYYFRFAHNGVPYAGNIRLAAATATRASCISISAISRTSGGRRSRPSAWCSTPRKTSRSRSSTP